MMMCLGVFLFGSNLFGILWASWTSWKSISLTRLGKFSFILCSNKFSISYKPLGQPETFQYPNYRGSKVLIYTNISENTAPNTSVHRHAHIAETHRVLSSNNIQHVSFFSNFYVLIFRERGREEWETEKHGFVVPLIYASIVCFMYMSLLGIEPTALAYRDDSNQLRYPARSQHISSLYQLLAQFFHEYIICSNTD